MRYYAPSLYGKESNPLAERFCEAFEEKFPKEENYTVGMYEGGEYYISVAGSEVFRLRDYLT